MGLNLWLAREVLRMKRFPWNATHGRKYG